MDPLVPDDECSRYARQIRFSPIGRSGQDRLGRSCALICGCGALGSVLANTLARAGVGHLRLVDRDFLELNNLQRQVLYDEQDVRDGLPKAVAAAQKLQTINSQIDVQPVVADVDHTSITRLIEGADIILDGTDNFETRFLLNDAAICYGIPWVYGGCIAAEGQTMTIVPGRTACLRCLVREPPPPGSTPTCDTAGILGPIVNIVASVQACEAIKILTGNIQAISRALTVIELWENRMRRIELDSLAQGSGCPTCQQRQFPWLSGQLGGHTAVLCGRNAVQLSFPDRRPVDLAQLQHCLQGMGIVTRNPYLLRCQIDGFTLTVFPDGRAIVSGTEDVIQAKTLYAKYIGH